MEYVAGWLAVRAIAVGSGVAAQRLAKGWLTASRWHCALFGSPSVLCTMWRLVAVVSCGRKCMLVLALRKSLWKCATDIVWPVFHFCTLCVYLEQSDAVGRE